MGKEQTVDSTRAVRRHGPPHGPTGHHPQRRDAAVG